MEKLNPNDYKDEIIDYSKVHKTAYVDVNEPLEKPPIAISIGQVTYGQTIFDCAFGTFGNFSCITGASKAKKTFLKSLILASFIGGNSNNYAEDIKSHRTKDMYILDFDTEQGKWHSQRVFKRVIQLSGGEYPMYKPFYLRRYDYKERLQFIEWCILESEYRNNIGMVNIDGFADLVKDVNDLESCNGLVAKMLKWTDISQCHLTGILHQNYDSKKPTGHLGSAILKKSETVCMLSKNDIEPNFVDVDFPYTRGFPIEKFTFSVNDFGLPVVEQKVLF